MKHGRDKVLIADGICDAVAISAAIPKLPENLITTMFWGGIVGQVVVAPTIHAIDGDYGRAGISLGIRIAGPVLGFLVGDLICEKVTKKNDVEFLRCLGGAFVGGVVGILAAQTTDWLVISKPTKVDTMPVAGMVFRF